MKNFTARDVIKKEDAMILNVSSPGLAAPDAAERDAHMAWRAGASRPSQGCIG
ncbi:MAG: hypothetical protein WDN49_20760 [Acetobacteraceae bacterium]